MKLDINPPTTSQSVDWYSEGESRTVEFDGSSVTVRFIGRRGRRGRIAISAPPGAAFREGRQAEDVPNGHLGEKRSGP